jgi:hypothetical protein
MPTTSQNVTLIKRRANNYSKEEILSAYSEFYQIVTGQNVEQLTKVDSTTGMPPTIATVDGQYEYDCPSDCREVAAVITQEPIAYRDVEKPYLESRSYFFRNKEFYRERVTSRSALPDGTPAKVTFLYNPGTSTDRFYLVYYIKKGAIENYDDQIDIPEELHWKFRRGVLLMLRQEEYGITRDAEIEMRRILRDVRNKLNSGAQGRSARTPIRPEFRDYEQ